MKRISKTILILCSLFQFQAFAANGKPPAAAEPAARKPAPARSWFYVFLSALSWQESPTLTSSTGTSHPMIATTIGLCPGIGWQYRFTSTMDGGINGCVIYGSGDIALERTSSPAPVSYSGTGVRVIGARLAPEFYWRVGSGDVAVGFAVPLVYRNADWPDPPAAGFAISSRSSIGAGFMLATRLQRGRFFVIPKIGIYRAPANLFWSFDAGIRL